MKLVARKFGFAFALGLSALLPAACGGGGVAADGVGGSIASGGGLASGGSANGGGAAVGGSSSGGGVSVGGSASGGGVSVGGSASGGGAAVGGGGDAAGGIGNVGGGGSASGGGGPAGGNGTGGDGAPQEWLPTWATTIQSLEASKTDQVPPIPLKANTLRQFIWPTVSGGKVRIQLSNEKGATALDIQKVHIALAKTTSDPGNSMGQIDATTDVAFTFNGMPNVTIPAGMTAWSDGVDFALPEIKLTAISIQFGQNTPPDTDITDHPGSRTTSYFATGDAVATEALTGAKTQDRWYIIDALEVMAPADAVAIACLGDSITDGYGILNKFARWTDAFTTAIKADPLLAHTRSVLNFGMGANNLTKDDADQDSGVKRFARDVLKRDKIKYLIVLEGVNDINGSPAVPATTVTAAYADIVAQARAKGIKVFVSPMTPMNASDKAARDQINTTVRAADYYDAGVDFDMAIRDSANPKNTQAQYKNDDLHPSEAGYKKMADSIDLTLFH